MKILGGTVLAGMVFFYAKTKGDKICATSKMRVFLLCTAGCGMI